MRKRLLTGFLALILILAFIVPALSGSLLFYPKFHALDSNGNILASGKLYTYIAGTSTNKATYSDRAATTPNANPVVLNARGEATVYLTGLYKLILKTSAGSTIWSMDNVQGDPQGNYVFYPDPSETDQCTTGAGNAFYDILISLGTSKKATIIFTHTGAANTTTYTCSTDYDISSYTNIEIKIEKGALLSQDSSKTLTLPSPQHVIAGKRQHIYTGAGTLAFNRVGTVYPGWWGAIGDDSTDDITAIQAALDALLTNGILDGGGLTYKITTAIDLSTVATLKNMTLHQTTQVEDVLKITGSMGIAPKLKNVTLKHDHNDASSGSLLALGDGGTIGFFEWKGSGLNSGGYYGVKGNGSRWHTNLERLWFYQTYSSGIYLPAQGDTVSTAQLGGSTLLSIKHVHIQEVQTADAAYAIGTGYDNVLIESSSADEVTNWGYFKGSPVHIINCYSEGVRDPVVGAVADPHRFIQFHSNYGFVVDGFRISINNAGFTAPTPGGGNYNSFVYTINPSNIHIAGVSGAFPTGGGAYLLLDQSGGISFVNNTEAIGNVRTHTGGFALTPKGATAHGGIPWTIDRLADDGVILQLDKDGTNHAHLLSVGDHITLGTDIDTASIILSTTTGGSVNRSVQLSPVTLSWFPVNDNVLSNGGGSNRWTEIFAVAGAINTSDAREKQQIAELTVIERQVATGIKKLFRTFKLNSEVANKGDKAGIHIGVIAQDVAEVFAAYGLDVNKYSLFSRTIWYEYNGKQVEVDEDDKYIEGLIKYNTIRKTRLGIRYTELLSFVISAM